MDRPRLKPVARGLVALAFLTSTGPALAEESRPQAAAQGGTDQDLAKKLSNPISDLVSIPFQFNWQNGVGVNDDLRFVLNIQPLDHADHLPAVPRSG